MPQKARTSGWLEAETSSGSSPDRNLVDEILLGVAPVTLGGGAPLLPRRLTTSDLELVDVEREGQFARLTYRFLRSG